MHVVEEVAGHRSARKRRPRGRPNEFECGLRGDDRYRGVERLDPAQNLSSLVGGDPATYAEDDLGFQASVSSTVTLLVSSRPSLISRRAMDSGFSCW